MARSPIRVGGRSAISLRLQRMPTDPSARAAAASAAASAPPELAGLDLEPFDDGFIPSTCAGKPTRLLRQPAFPLARLPPGLRRGPFIK